MDGSAAKKSTSLETLVIQNITNVNDLKAKLNDIIKSGKDYEYDVSSCLKTLLTSSDQDIVVLTVQAISELVKCEEKRETYSNKEIIEPIIYTLDKEVYSSKPEIVKQCCRAIGNLCCDCDAARSVIQECNGIKVLKKLLEYTLGENNPAYDDIKLLVSKTLLNFAIGGSQFSETIVQENVISVLYKILLLELEKDDMNDEVVSSALLIMSVINDNTPDYLFEENVNKAVLSVLRETTNVEISELCLDHLHAQAEHDSVKTLLANEGGMQLVCSRLEQLMAKQDAGDVNAEESEVEAIIKQACDLIIIVLIGDEAMHTLYHNGFGEVYLTMVRWLDSNNRHLLTTAVLAIGNFARQDDYCTQMMDNKIFDKLLDIFEVYHGFGVRMSKEPDAVRPIDPATVIKIQHAVLSALRNLIVSVANKRKAASGGRAAPLLLGALPHVEQHHVAYKLLAAVRMLVDGQESVAKQLASDRSALSAVARWGHAGEYAGAAGEAPRLLAWAVKQLRHSTHWRQIIESVAKQLASDRSALSAVARWGHAGEYAGAAGEAPRLLAWAVKQLRHSTHWRQIIEVDGCVSSLVNMLVVCHSVMQNEAILALTLLGIESLNSTQAETPGDFDYEKSFISQLIKSEIGKHVSVLIETNCAKLPKEVAENLLAFLDITSKNNKVAADYKEAKVHESLRKLSDSRTDFSGDLKTCISGVADTISSNGNAK